MKIRNGFVSNSSSSSFCIYGAYINKDRVDEEVVEKLGLGYHRGNPYEATEMVPVSAHKFS